MLLIIKFPTMTGNVLFWTSKLNIFIAFVSLFACFEFVSVALLESFVSSLPLCLLHLFLFVSLFVCLFVCLVLLRS